MAETFNFLPLDVQQIQKDLLDCEVIISYLINLNQKRGFDEDIAKMLAEYDELYELYLVKISEYIQRMQELGKEDILVRIRNKIY